MVKLEQGPLEQTFKVQEFDLTSEEDIKVIVSEEFIQTALQRFELMGQALNDAMTKI